MSAQSWMFWIKNPKSVQFKIKTRSWPWNCGLPTALKYYNTTFNCNHVLLTRIATSEFGNRTAVSCQFTPMSQYKWPCNPLMCPKKVSHCCVTILWCNWPQDCKLIKNELGRELKLWRYNTRENAPLLWKRPMSQLFPLFKRLVLEISCHHSRLSGSLWPKAWRNDFQLSDCLWNKPPTSASGVLERRSHDRHPVTFN